MGLGAKVRKRGGGEGKVEKAEGMKRGIGIDVRVSLTSNRGEFCRFEVRDTQRQLIKLLCLRTLFPFYDRFQDLSNKTGVGYIPLVCYFLDAFQQVFRKAHINPG